nr:hypothetical protein [Virgisporangium aurantiacum]
MVDRQVERVGRADTGGDGHQEQWEDQTHPQHGDHDADGEEQGLPALRHPAQDRRVHHRVVEGERDLQDRQDDHEHDDRPAAVQQRTGQPDRRGQE